ncbi:rhsD, partial [Escherichia coli 0.1304]
PRQRTWISISRMQRTRQETGCRTRNCTRTAPSRHGRITASRKMRTMSTATMNTAGWRRRRTASRKGLSGCTTSAPTTITTTASTAWCSTRGYSTANHRWRAGTSMTRWAAGRENGCGGGSVT